MTEAKAPQLCFTNFPSKISETEKLDEKELTEERELIIKLVNEFCEYLIKDFFVPLMFKEANRIAREDSDLFVLLAKRNKIANMLLTYDQKKEYDVNDLKYLFHVCTLGVEADLEVKYEKKFCENDLNANNFICGCVRSKKYMHHFKFKDYLVEFIKFKTGFFLDFSTWMPEKNAFGLYLNEQMCRSACN